MSVNPSTISLERISNFGLSYTADVLLENSHNGAMERLGLGYEALATRNNRLIYASVTGFGQSGPYAGRPAYEHLLQAFSGGMHHQGEDGRIRALNNLVSTTGIARYSLMSTTRFSAPCGS